MEIRVKTADPVVAYAAAELARCARAMDANAGGSLALGLFEDCGVRPGRSLPDRALDDALRVEVRSGSGHIAGANPRSVLLGVYRFLWELGCRWVRPGPAGEVIPRRDLEAASVSLDEAASYRHRVVCIEGAVSLSNVLDMIEWMPKVGFNGYYVQFREGYTFFDRWYSHEDNPRRRRKETLERSTAQEFTALIEKELARRGLLYHAVGHGWHAEAYGVPGLGWMDLGPLPQEFMDKLALVSGRRVVPWNVPMLAALCYSDPDVQARMVWCIADYAETRRNVDYLHVWLDDWMNNKCECERCRAKRPFDFYVQILNALDDELTRRGLGTKIVFLAYSDLLWPPAEDWFGRSERFTFMYANSREDYRRPLARVTGVEPVPFKLNGMTDAVKAVDQVAAFLQDWKRRFTGDSFVFEYYGGAETVALARVMWQDIRNLRDFSVNGMVSCQAQRVFFPTGLGMVVMGRTLWNSALDFDGMAADYFEAAYGPDGEACRQFVQEAQATGDTVGRALTNDTDGALRAARSFGTTLARFEPTIERNRAAASDPCRALSWRMMRVYADVLRMFIEYVEAKSAGRQQAAALVQTAARQYLFGVEDELQPYMEPMHFMRRFIP